MLNIWQIRHVEAAGGRGRPERRAGRILAEKNAINTSENQEKLKFLVLGNTGGLSSAVPAASTAHLHRRGEEVVIVVLPVVVEERRRLAEVCHDAGTANDN